MENKDSKLPLVDIQRVRQRAADFGFRPATYNEIIEGCAVAEELMQSKIAAPAEIARMHEITQMTAWVCGDPVDGIFLTLPLTAAGEAAVRDGSYVPAHPMESHLCPPGGDCRAFYVGVYAGATHAARKSIMTAAAVMRVELFGAFPSFARGATSDGRRSMESLGFVPVSGGLPDLYVQEPLVGRRDEAA